MYNSFQTEVLRMKCKKIYLSHMNVNMLAENFRTHTLELVELIERFDPVSFNQRPADNGWTAGEVTEHLLLFDIHLNRVLGSIDKPAGRDPLAKVAEYTPRITVKTKYKHRLPLFRRELRICHRLWQQRSSLNAIKF